MRRALLALALLGVASSASAQGPAPLSPSAPSNGVVFVPRYDFHLGADHLASADPRFVWDTNFGGEIDFLDYGYGRLRFAANYEAVLGEQFRAFDPNQGNYLLDLSSSWRVRGVEAAALFHHLSRHLSDRFKRDPDDWNMFGVAVARTFEGRAPLRVHGEALRVLLRSNVDYTWETDAGVGVRVPLRGRRVSAIAGGDLRLVGVNGTFDRGTQHGGRVEGGLRFEGERGAVELVLRGERRIDAYPLETAALSWFGAGFRFVSR
jgi:hypothetical protein